MAKPLTLKVLTLNAWGIRLPGPFGALFGSKDLETRINAIAEALATGEYDLVALQEIWSVSDYEFIKDRVKKVMPNAFYFQSGFIGSGVCIFTKGIIESVLMHRYSLNGYPHHVHRGDWFGGKVVGLARIRLNGLSIDVYATHLHAEYDKDNDLYLPHRVLQSYELSQFISGTTRGDMILVMGDLNLEPTDFGYHLITTTACLNDAYETRANRVEGATEDDPFCGSTCDVPSNCYSIQSTKDRWPNGKRIDYVLYRANEKFKIVSRKCCPALGRIPSHPNVNYSDHEAVCAEFEVTPTDVKPTISCAQFPDEAIKLMDRGIASAVRWRWIFAAMVVVMLVVFFYTIGIEVKCEQPAITLLALVIRFGLTLAIGFYFVYGLVGLKMEEKALVGAKAGMIILKRA